MNLKSVTLAFILAFPGASFALGPVNPIETYRIKTEQFKAISGLMEDGLGRPLSSKEQIELARVMKPFGPLQPNEPDDDHLIIRVSNTDTGVRDASNALYCIGFDLGAGMNIKRALCASLQTMRTYDLAVVGAGLNAQIQATIFRLTVSFDKSRYSPGFDPIPGAYGLGTVGGTLGLGMTSFTGDSGNKSVSGLGINFGIGIDGSTLSALVIQ